MTTFTEQFSAVGKSQVETHMNFFQSLTAKALDSAQKLIALNLNTSRASMEKSSAVVVELLAAKDPRDLFALTKRTQESINGLLAYNRELIAIATGGSHALAQAAAAPLTYAEQIAAPAPTPALEAEPAVQFDAPLAEPEPAAQSAVLEVVAEMPVDATPIAKAVSQVAAKPLSTQPAAAPVDESAAEPVIVKGIKPVDAAPPPAPVSGTPAIAQQQELAAAKGKKKK